MSKPTRQMDPRLAAIAAVIALVFALAACNPTTPQPAGGQPSAGPMSTPAMQPSSGVSY